METKETAALKDLIREMIMTDRRTINGEIVTEAKKRLSILTSHKRISQLRNQIGLGFFQLYDLRGFSNGDD